MDIKAMREQRIINHDVNLTPEEMDEIMEAIVDGKVRDMGYVAPLDITDEDSENWDFRSKAANVMSRNDYLDYKYQGKV